MLLPGSTQCVQHPLLLLLQCRSKCWAASLAEENEYLQSPGLARADAIRRSGGVVVVLWAVKQYLDGWELQRTVRQSPPGAC